jgi:hypothetical protein
MTFELGELRARPSRERGRLNLLERSFRLAEVFFGRDGFICIGSSGRLLLPGLCLGGRLLRRRCRLLRWSLRRRRLVLRWCLRRRRLRHADCRTAITAAVDSVVIHRVIERFMSGSSNGLASLLRAR